jgi:hypothetical protein
MSQPGCLAKLPAPERALQAEPTAQLVFARVLPGIRRQEFLPHTPASIRPASFLFLASLRLVFSLTNLLPSRFTASSLDVM